ncbi:hypothetical protein ACFPM0_15665 [Pseudonocardia sulfidoxydans]|uniref:hypothetical protein n=1 Tax=Pseudonocardia sulfidoxydans TaxID=54011 RepID=UPI00360B1797
MVRRGADIGTRGSGRRLRAVVRQGADICTGARAGPCRATSTRGERRPRPAATARPAVA